MLPEIASNSVLIRSSRSRQGLEYQTTNLGVRSSNLFGRAKLPPFRIKLRTRGLDRPIVIGPLLAQLSGEAKLRQADIG
jgi:hypothetical protein